VAMLRSSLASHSKYARYFTGADKADEVTPSVVDEREGSGPSPPGVSMFGSFGSPFDPLSHRTIFNVIRKTCRSRQSYTYNGFAQGLDDEKKGGTCFCLVKFEIVNFDANNNNRERLYSATRKNTFNPHRIYAAYPRSSDACGVYGSLMDQLITVREVPKQGC